MKTDRYFKTNPLESCEKRKGNSMSPPELILIVLTASWIIASAYLLMSETLNGDGTFIIQLVVVFMPLALLSLCFIIMRASRVMQEETQMLQTAVNALRKAYTNQIKLQEYSDSSSAIEGKLEELSKAQNKIQNTLEIISNESFTSSKRSARGRR